MKPYYSEDGITIYHGDCREIRPEAETVITDPPYGVGMDSFEDNFSSGCDGFNSANGKLAAVFMSPRRVPDFISAVDSWTFERLLWMHKTADIAAPWRGWCMNSEAIIILSRPGALWPTPTRFRSDTYSIGPWERAGHPNGKPLEVVIDLLSRLDSGKILDPFMGSGTVLRAAKDLRREAVGIEIEERYCEIAAKRLAQKVLPLEACR